MLWYNSTNWLAGLNVNIPTNKREFFRLAKFGALSIYIAESEAGREL
jgi:hypothetical protein